MQHFIIYFRHCGKKHNAKVQKINISPVRFVVYDIHPSIARLPQRVVFVSNPEQDQLIYESQQNNQNKVLLQMGETIFRICDLQKINVHA